MTCRFSGGWGQVVAHKIGEAQDGGGEVVPIVCNDILMKERPFTMHAPHQQQLESKGPK